MGHKRRQEDKRRNLVHKYAHKFNKAATMVDRKRATKAGKVKHKGEQYDN